MHRRNEIIEWTTLTFFPDANANQDEDEVDTPFDALGTLPPSLRLLSLISVSLVFGAAIRARLEAAG
jgi:hypothetical protein